MSFTSQNYGVRKFKRMDKVLVDCAILSIIVSVVIGGGSSLLGHQILGIYTKQEDVIQCGMEILSISTIPDSLCGPYGYDSGYYERSWILSSSYATFL